MGFFKRKKQDRDFVDLTRNYKKEQTKISEMKQEFNENSSENPTPFSIFGSATPNNSDSGMDFEGTPHEKRKRLAKRLMDMTNKIEDLSNQIYRLQQKVEFLERRDERSY
jgi:peptidoglycan hydrolase CwlO-like protein